MKEKWQKKENIIFRIVSVLLLTFAIICMSIFCYGASINGDEYFSIGFANNTKDFLFLSQGAIERYGDNGWIDGEFLHDWLSVQPGEGFAIMPIHRNVRSDVHPPLYFMLLNGISSFFVDRVTLFPGYLINVVSGIAIVVFLYLIARKIFRNRWLALMPSVLWISSNAAGITMSYLRMYAPLCALCLICVYIHILFLNQEKPSKWIYFVLGVSTTIGTLTHYYYYLMLFILFWITVIMIIYRKQIKKLLLYGVSLLTGEIISILAYPYVFRHLLFSERGTQVQENLGNFSDTRSLGFFKEFLHTINTYVYNGRFQLVFYLVMALAVLAIIMLFVHRKIGENVTIADRDSVLINQTGKTNFILVILATTGYFFILFCISYSSRWLYMSPIFALLSLITIGILAKLIEKVTPKYYVYPFFLFIILMVMTDKSSMESSLREHHYVEERHKEIVSYSNQCDVIFVYDKWNNLYDNQILELMDFDQIYTTTKEEVATIDFTSIIQTRKQPTHAIMLYLPKSLDNCEQVAELIKTEIGATKVTPIEDEDHAIYYMQMEGIDK